MAGQHIKKGGQKTSLIFITFALLLPAGIVLAVCVGKYPITPGESIAILWSSLMGGLPEQQGIKESVVLGLRIPRILGSVIVGAALSVSGAVYQGSFRNPLVSQDILGVSSGACIGAAIGILSALSAFHISLLAFAGGIAAILLTMAIPAIIRNHSNIMLVLSGIIVGSAMSSVLGFIKYIADPNTQLASIIYWTMGSFSYITLPQLGLVLPLIAVPMLLLFFMAWWIDVLSMGEDEARALGANVRLIRGFAIICATLLTAAAVCLCGTIGWIGLIVPHFGRLFVGPSNRRLLPLSALIGGLLMLLVDTLTRTISPLEMPVSILTGIIGAPFYCWLLYRQRRSLG